MKKKTEETPPELPYDVDMEQAALGVFLMDNYWFDRVGGDVRPDDFYDPLHQRIAETMLALRNAGTPITPLTVKAAMGEDEGFAEVGGVKYLSSLARGAPVMPAMGEYLRIISDMASRRQCIHIGNQLIDAAYHTSSGIAPIAYMTAEVLCDAVSGSEAKRAQRAEDVAMTMLEGIEAERAGKPVPKIPTGIRKLDAWLGGLRGSDLIVCPGRSGMGKSALLGSIAVRAAIAGFPVLVFSLEMRAQQWIERTLCDLDYDTGWQDPVEYRFFRVIDKLTGEHFDRIARAQMRLVGLPLEIIDDDTLTIEDIAARARAFKAKHGPIGLIVADYLQITRAPPGDRGRSREQEITQIARGYKSMAKQLNWPVVVGAQILSKTVDQRPEKDRRPTASDIRESGSIENEADLILAPYRPAFYVYQRRPGSDATDAEWASWNADLSGCKNDFEINAIKHRHGPLFGVHLHCNMGASAIRDEQPFVTQPDKGAGLLELMTGANR